MRTVPMPLISPFDNRELTTRLIQRATGLGPTPAHNLVLTLDAVSAGVLRAAGIPGVDGLPILGALWRYPPRLAEPRRQRTTVPGGQEQQYLADLGQRVHVLRHARRLTPTGVQNRTALPAAVLHDLEAGLAWPSTLVLHRLARAFDVPLPLLVDEKATPLRILRLLSGQTA